MKKWIILRHRLFFLHCGRVSVFSSARSLKWDIKHEEKLLWAGNFPADYPHPLIALICFSCFSSALVSGNRTTSGFSYFFLTFFFPYLRSRVTGHENVLLQILSSFASDPRWKDCWWRNLDSLRLFRNSFEIHGSPVFRKNIDIPYIQRRMFSLIRFAFIQMILLILYCHCKTMYYLHALSTERLWENPRWNDSSN